MDEYTIKKNIELHINHIEHYAADMRLFLYAISDQDIYNRIRTDTSEIILSCQAATEDLIKYEPSEE